MQNWIFCRVLCNRLIHLKIGTWVLLRLRLIGKGVFRQKKLFDFWFPKNFENFLKNREKLFATSKNIWIPFASNYYWTNKSFLIVFNNKKLFDFWFPKNFRNFLRNRKKLFPTNKNNWKLFASSYYCKNESFLIVFR